jgi:hypothetical protein
MQGVHLKVIAAADPDIFQERLNRFIESLPNEALIVEIRYSTASNGSHTNYSALLQYKTVEEWVE